MNKFKLLILILLLSFSHNLYAFDGNAVFTTVYQTFLLIPLLCLALAGKKGQESASARWIVYIVCAITLFLSLIFAIVFENNFANMYLNILHISCIGVIILTALQKTEG